MRSENFERLLKEIPLKTRLRVSNTTAFINLLSELGFLKGYWGPDEDEKLKRLCELADEHTQYQLNEIKEWEEDGRP
jgi:predicted transcriptional regulator